MGQKGKMDTRSTVDGIDTNRASAYDQPMSIKSTAAICSTLVLSASSAFALVSADFQGKPSAFGPGQQTGAAVWHDGQRLHVQVSSRDGSIDLGGKVCAKSVISGLTTDELEPSDSVKVGPKGRCVWLKMTTDEDVDGFSFVLPRGIVFFDLKLGLHQLPPQQIWVGAAGVHPSSSPFTLNQ